MKHNINRRNEERFTLEAQDVDKSLRAQWVKIKEAVGPQINARLTEAKKQFPDLAFNEDVSSNAVVLRFLMEAYLKGIK